MIQLWIQVCLASIVLVCHTSKHFFEVFNGDIIWFNLKFNQTSDIAAAASELHDNNKPLRFNAKKVQKEFYKMNLRKWKDTWLQFIKLKKYQNWGKSSMMIISLFLASLTHTRNASHMDSTSLCTMTNSVLYYALWSKNIADARNSVHEFGWLS